MYLSYLIHIVVLTFYFLLLYWLSILEYSFHLISCRSVIDTFAIEYSVFKFACETVMYELGGGVANIKAFGFIIPTYLSPLE